MSFDALNLLAPTEPKHIRIEQPPYELKIVTCIVEARRGMPHDNVLTKSLKYHC